jgi:hypothetical protein
MKTHRQVVFATMAPPINGPIVNATNDIIAMKAVYLGRAFGDTASEIMTMGRLKTPAPEIP